MWKVALVCLLCLGSVGFVVGDYRPTTQKGVPFLETFQSCDDLQKCGWRITQNTDYTGKWDVRGIENSTLIDDVGLVMTTGGSRYGILHLLTPSINPHGKDLVIQYEVRFSDGITCGGAYIKVLTHSTALSTEQLNEETPYTIMFGPDKCGTTNKVHFIFRHLNPKTNQYEEKHLKAAPSIKNDKLTHLYTLHVADDNGFEIFIDQESVKRGSLLTDFEPEVNPPKTIDDPTDEKPADWVDEAQIPDPTAVKPEDWDESQPKMIDDPNDTKPENWLDNEPKEIPDPTAKRPAQWDEESDGKWEAETIPNPKCKDAGCGEWKAKQIKNPAYKGVWRAPKIPNPAYKGEWKPRQITNPNYFQDDKPSDFTLLGGVGIEVLANDANVMFDNLVIGHEFDVIEQFGRDTWLVKSTAEKAAAEKAKPKKDEKPAKETDKKKPTKVADRRSQNRKVLQHLETLNDLWDLEMIVAVFTESIYTWCDWAEIAWEYTVLNPVVVAVSVALAIITPILLCGRSPKQQYFSIDDQQKKDQ
eukprot:TRINITY_DN7466_c0_g1_i1.p1 TRINITY_DN7466_c0_g1~~TRINITY_DN7466_c0_g1_i1.p1  ORF type:complete len:529 (+),score=113.01 TRINITY_DN7466_c0_g1_i1:77-1663(+)